MAKKVTQRRVGELLRVLFEILIENPDGIQARDAIRHLVERVTMTEHEAGTYKDGALRLDRIMRFATVDCSKAGWMTKEKGIWSITDEGRAAFDAYSNPLTFYKTAARLYREWRSRTPSDTGTDDDVDDATEVNDASITFEQAEEWAWAEISDLLTKMNPYEFQDLVADLLKAMGYYVAWVAPPGKDRGIDILAYTDPLGTSTPRIKVQVKRQAASVAVDGLRSFLAVLGDDDVGLFVNSGGFTRDARFEARTQEKRKVTLINLQQLFDLWVEHYSALEESARRRLPLTPIYFLSPQP